MKKLIVCFCSRFVSDVFSAKKLALAAVLGLFMTAPAFAGPWYLGCLAAASTACVAPSLLTPAPPLTWTLCVQKAAALCALACFSVDTTVKVLENGHEIDRSVDSIRSDDLVRTLKNGEFGWTKVVKNTRSEGIFEFVQIEAVNSTNKNRRQLKVTPTHGLILLSHDGQRTLDAADNLAVGDRIIASNGDILTVSHLDRVLLKDKYTLETADGTILASDIFVSTICDEEVSEGEQLFDEKIKDWQTRHPHLLLEEKR